MEIKNLEKTAKRILKAVKNKEKVILYGDADLDGTASVIILEEAIRNLGGNNIVVYFVDRQEEGYGINKKALENLKKEAPALFITLDLGITNFKETKIAQKMGFEVIIIDHHTVIDNVPEASIVVDPKQEGDNYPFKELANVGIVYRLAKILLKDRLEDSLNDEFLELTAIATIADMMSRTEENKIYIEKGLELLKTTNRPGLKFFLKYDFFENFSQMEKIQKIISVLNITRLENHFTGSYLLLMTKDDKEAEILGIKLLDIHNKRYALVQKISKEMEQKILKNFDTPVIFEGSSDSLSSLNGAIASKLCNKYKKPTFIFHKKKDISIGTVRMPKGLNAVEAMKSCEKLLVTFGGHPPAAGFTIKNENLDKFEKCLIKYFNKLTEKE